jgi:hypothetical protein
LGAVPTRPRSGVYELSSPYSNSRAIAQQGLATRVWLVDSHQSYRPGMASRRVPALSSTSRAVRRCGRIPSATSHLAAFLAVSSWSRIAGILHAASVGSRLRSRSGQCTRMCSTVSLAHPQLQVGHRSVPGNRASQARSPRTSARSRKSAVASALFSPSY